MHLVDASEGPAKGKYNMHLVKPGLVLLPGWKRTQELSIAKVMNALKARQLWKRYAMLPAIRPV